MARLGEFGAAQRELSGEQDDFGFFGETFTVTGAIPPMLMLQLAAAATGKIDESEGMAAMWEALRCSLTKPKRIGTDGAEVDADPAQFNKLYKLAVENACDIESLMRLVFALFEVQGGRPTQPVSGSSPGPSTTSQSSSVSSTPAAQSRLRSVDSLIRGDSNTIEVVADPGMIEMGDGELVQFIPAERTG
jgi:hypothetical protein